MGSLARAFLPITMKHFILLLGLCAYVQAGSRIRRSPQDSLAPIAPLKPLKPIPAPYAPEPVYEPVYDQEVAGSSAYAPPPRGKVGPVYTFVKTDPKANFKWGVRHVAG